jgi:tetratricopeptide (TPR) repeat protein
MDGRNEEAHARYALAAERYPQDKEVLYMAGDLYFHEGKAAEALPLFERSLALDPTWEPGLMHLTDSLAALGRKDDLLARSRWWVEKAPSGASYRALASAHAIGGRWNEAVEAARRAFDLDGSGFSRAVLGEALCLVERYEEAEALLRPGPEATVAKADHNKGIPTLVAALAYQGKRREALRVLETAPDDQPSKMGELRLVKLLHLLGEASREPALRLAREAARQQAKPGVKTGGLATILLLAGDPERATELAKKLEPGPDRMQYQATLAWKQGEREKALSLLRQLTGRPDSEHQAYSLWLTAQVQLESRHDPEAIASLEAFRAARASFWRSWAYPQSFYLEALARERLGDLGKARDRVEHLLRLWKHADADARYLAEAGALQRRLGSRTAP